MTLLPVQPLRRHRGLCFVDRQVGDELLGSIEPVSVAAYPLENTQQGARLRLARQRAKMTLGELARELGIRVSDVSSLERGAKTMTPRDWKKTMGWLRRLDTSTLDVDD